jgi:arrestin-related trafficking adapter 1
LFGLANIAVGTHPFPFSVLLGGHLPATLDTPLTSVIYEFKAEAITVRSPTSSNNSCAPIKFERIFDVKRSLPEPDIPHHSVRVFPPTNIKASAHYDQIIHPTGSHNMSMRLDGLTSVNNSNNTTEYWKLKKISWRLEETMKTIAPACERHAPGGPASEGKKGVQRVETRGLGERVMFDGWKADYSTDGNIEVEFEYGVHTHRLYGHQHRYACDSKSRDGTEVSHQLLIEMVVSREWAPTGKPHLTTQTGTGRILRMHYAVNMSEFSGLGVSWDNEAPPVYQDVPPSPPAYPDVEGPVDYEDLEPLDAERSSVEGRFEHGVSDEA